MPRRPRTESGQLERLDDWISGPMPDGPLAIAYPISRVRETDDAPSPAEAVALAMADRRVAVVRREAVGRFLLAHADRDIVCDRAEDLYIALREGPLALPDGGAAEVLRQLCDANRLHDVGLLDQLVRLACSGEHPAPLEIGRVELAAPDDERCRALTESLPAGVMLNPPGCLAQLARVRHLYQERRRMTRVAVEARREETREHGPLSLGLQVGAKVALRYATRAGIRLAKHSSGEVLERLLGRHADARETLRKSGEAMSWLPAPADRSRVARGRWPAIDKDRLRAWLERRGDALVDDNKAGLQLPRTAGGVAALPEYWGVLLRVDPLLRAWADLNLAERLARAIGGEEAGECVLRPRYEVIPQVRPINPDLREFRRLCGPLRFVPREGRRFLVARVPGLELRCFAKYVEECVMPSSLSGMILGRPGRDPVRRIAMQVLGREDGREGYVPPPEDAEDPGKPPFPEARLGRAMRIVEACFEAAMSGLGSPHARTILRLEHGIELGLTEATAHWTLISGMYQELEAATEDATMDVVCERLGCEIKDLRALIHEAYPESSAAALRKVLLGESENPRLFRSLRGICRDERTRAVLAAGRGGMECYLHFFSAPQLDPRGALRRAPLETVGRGRRHMDAHADAIKLAVVGLARAGLDLAAVAGEELVVEATPAEAGEGRVAEIVDAALRGRLGDHSPACIVEPAESW